MVTVCTQASASGEMWCSTEEVMRSSVRWKRIESSANRAVAELPPSKRGNSVGLCSSPPARSRTKMTDPEESVVRSGCQRVMASPFQRRWVAPEGVAMRERRPLERAAMARLRTCGPTNFRSEGGVTARTWRSRLGSSSSVRAWTTGATRGRASWRRSSAARTMGSQWNQSRMSPPVSTLWMATIVMPEWWAM